jgi:hypothetical protein
MCSTSSGCCGAPSLPCNSHEHARMHCCRLQQRSMQQQHGDHHERSRRLTLGPRAWPMRATRWPGFGCPSADVAMLLLLVVRAGPPALPRAAPPLTAVSLMSWHVWWTGVGPRSFGAPRAHHSSPCTQAYVAGPAHTHALSCLACMHACMHAHTCSSRRPSSCSFAPRLPGASAASTSCPPASEPSSLKRAS